MKWRNGGCCLPIFLALFFVIGLGVIGWGARILKNASVSSDWPSTQGEITASAVRVDHDEDGVTYHAQVSYQYVVDDRRYTADTVNFGQYGSSNPDHAEEIVSHYRPGEGVMVYYNPDKPEMAVLEPGVSWSSYMVLGIGFVFALIPFLILVGSILRPFVRL